MFNQVPDFPPFLTDPTGAPQVQDYNQMLELINAIMTTAPEYNDSGLVGFPINAILNWSMATPGGFAAFLNDKVNAQLKHVLNQWGVYLTSKESTYVLNDGPNGWFSEAAIKDMDGISLEPLCVIPLLLTMALPPGTTSSLDYFNRTFVQLQIPMTKT